MNESSQRQRHPTKTETLDRTTPTRSRVRKAMDERLDAVRRWIADDDDDACRGID